jgi:hypothetical protein
MLTELWIKFLIGLIGWSAEQLGFQMYFEEEKNIITKIILKV